MKPAIFITRLGIATVIACMVPLMDAQAQEPACRSGAIPAANAYILSNPIYSYYYGSLDEYVGTNQVLFQQGSDAVRCLSALSRTLLGQAIRLYDPAEQNRRDEINARMESMGLSRGQQQSTPSSEIYAMSMQLGRLARGLPAAAVGDWNVYRTATTELEQMQTLAEDMLRVLLQSSEMQAVMESVRPMVMELAKIEHSALLKMGNQLAGSQ